MTFQGDPYRTLGVAPGASLNEIRSAYRRLAKQYHPDAAGERALPRFLAIQAAYEWLVDGEGRLRRAPGRGGGPGAAGGGAEPWRADPARARASRDAWRARRAGTTADAAGAGGAGPARGAGGGERGADEPGAGRRGETRDRRGGTPGDGRDRPPRRSTRKATQGSTTYDEATEGPRDPEWEGGSWYGANSRTYWTINPREYADPRKHGPEYQARARRATRADEEADASGWGWEEGPAPGHSTTDGGASDWGGGAWTYETGGMADADAPAGAAGAGRTQPDADPRASADPRTGTGRRAQAGFRRGSASRPWSAPWPASTVSPSADDIALPDLEAIARRASPLNLLATARRPQRRWRLLLALIGWPPVGYAVGTLLSTVTGCAQLAASCREPVPALSMLVQPLVVAGLFLAAPAAALAAFASILALIVAVPVAAVLSVGTVPESRVGASVLGAIVTVAYLVSLVAGGIVLWRPSKVRVAGGDNAAGGVDAADDGHGAAGGVDATDGDADASRDGDDDRHGGSEG